ncbi:MAG: glycosyltransferase [Prevotellaceae bacterium]|nr:glycosyltransferase [Prevotellaceae bacterium]
MKTVMFYTRYQPVCERGGTEHTTIVTARELKQRYGIRTIAAYQIDFKGTYDSFDFIYRLSRDYQKATEKAIEIVKKHQVDTIVIQGYFREMKIFARVKEATNCKLIFAHHFQPGWEKLDRQQIASKIANHHGFGRLRYQLKDLLFPIFRWQSRMNLKKRYFRTFRQADRIVVLSPAYIQPFLKKAAATATQSKKISVIPNMLPFPPDVAGDLHLEGKEKIALIVSRLDERQKRIHLALDLWKEALKDEVLKDWHLYVIGDDNTPSVPAYEQWAKENNIPNVTFLGRTYPVPYYKKASVFLMSSICEGLPLTILESKQFGVVPIAFNTFGAVHDIIHNGEDGYIIEERDNAQYVASLKKLMTDSALRKDMALRGLDNLSPFNVEQVIKKWNEIL